MDNPIESPATGVAGSLGRLPIKRFLLVLLGFWFLLYGSFTLINPPLLDDADSVHAEVAREMLARHDYVTLYADGIRYLEKAPLLYWSMGASYKLFGVSEFSTRLLLALYMLGLVLAVFVLGRRLFSGPLKAEERGFDCGVLWCADPADVVRDVHLYAYYDSRWHGLPVGNRGGCVFLEIAAGG